MIFINRVYKRKKLRSCKNYKKKKENTTSKYISNNLPILNKNAIPKFTRVQTFGIEKGERKLQQIPNNPRKNNSRGKISKYSLEPISRHNNLLESSREIKPLNEIYNKENIEKIYDTKSGKKKDNFNKVFVNNNMFKMQLNEENQYKRQLSVSKHNKPFSSHLSNLNIVPFIRNDNDEINFKDKFNEELNNINENLLPNTRKHLSLKENFDKISHELVNSKSKNGMKEFSSNNNKMNIANKLNYNENFAKNIPIINTNIDYQKIFEKTHHTSSNAQKQSVNKKRDSSKNKDIINFNSNYLPKKVVNTIPLISSLNNSNERPFSQNEINFFHNNIIPSKWKDTEGVLRINSKPIEEISNNLKEMPIPGTNLYSGKGNYSRIHSGYRDLKNRNEFNKKDEIHFPRNTAYNSHKD